MFLLTRKRKSRQSYKKDMGLRVLNVEKSYFCDGFCRIFLVIYAENARSSHSFTSLETMSTIL